MVAMKVILVLYIWNNVGLFEAASFDSTTTDSLIPKEVIPCTNDSLCRCEQVGPCIISDLEICTTKYKEVCYYSYDPPKCQLEPYEDCQMVSKTRCHENKITCKESPFVL